MGRQWLHAKRAVASMKKAQATGKIVREMMVAAKMGGPDPESNARLAAAVEKARKESVSRDVIERATGARFLTDRTAVHAVSRWLSQHGWRVITSELGYVPKNYPELNPQQQLDAGQFLQQLEDHDDVHRVWAALR